MSEEQVESKAEEMAKIIRSGKRIFERLTKKLDQDMRFAGKYAWEW